MLNTAKNKTIVTADERNKQIIKQNKKEKTWHQSKTNLISYQKYHISVKTKGLISLADLDRAR
jgi:hypothetical protein